MLCRAVLLTTAPTRPFAEVRIDRLVHHPSPHVGRGFSGTGLTVSGTTGSLQKHATEFRKPSCPSGARDILHLIASTCVEKCCTGDNAAGPGKHTFLEGGVRVMAFISGPQIPPGRRGTRWTGMAASADWYKTIVGSPDTQVATLLALDLNFLVRCVPCSVEAAT